MACHFIMQSDVTRIIDVDDEYSLNAAGFPVQVQAASGHRYDLIPHLHPAF